MFLPKDKERTEFFNVNQVVEIELRNGKEPMVTLSNGSKFLVTCHESVERLIPVEVPVKKKAAKRRR